jgi:hypothetical protein
VSITRRSSSSQFSTGDDHRLPDLGDELQQRRVRQVARGHLVDRHVEVGEHLRAREVEGRGEERDAELCGVRLQLLVLRTAEFERLAVQAVRRSVAVLVVVRPVEHLARVHPGVVALLELHRVRAALRSPREELLALLERPAVVVADLGDHPAVAVVCDAEPVDRQFA